MLGKKKSFKQAIALSDEEMAAISVGLNYASFIGGGTSGMQQFCPVVENYVCSCQNPTHPSGCYGSSCCFYVNGVGAS